jgi:hypothetical protein
MQRAFMFGLVGLMVAIAMAATSPAVTPGSGVMSHLPLATSATFDLARSSWYRGECGVDCSQPPTCLDEFDDCGHKAPEDLVSPSHKVGLEPHGWCFEGYCNLGTVGCEAKHELCEAQEVLPQLLSYLAEGDLAGLHTMTLAGAGVEFIDHEQLMAVRGCDRRVLATVALEPYEAAALAMMEASF